MPNDSTKRIIREIPENPFMQNQTMRKKLRVAAYCRVSTEQEEQESSFDNQVIYYTNLIQSNPEWEFAGIFADRGISGTKDTIRPEFMKMIEQCKKRKIDLIFTKSLSRFSRNTLDSIKYIRLLKSLNVAVEFEKEGLNTNDVSSEIYLTWFSAFAQAESESISQNVTMGMRRHYKEGKFAFRYKNFLGYRAGPDGQPEIDPKKHLLFPEFSFPSCVAIPRNKLPVLWRWIGFLPQQERTAGPKRLSEICCAMKNMPEMCYCKKLIPLIFWKRRYEKTEGRSGSITLPIITRLLFQGKFFRRYNWKLQGAAASGRFHAGKQNPNKENTPASLLYPKEQSAGNVGPCTDGQCGSSGMEQRNTFGDV